MACFSWTLTCVAQPAGDGAGPCRLPTLPECIARHTTHDLPFRILFVRLAEDGSQIVVGLPAINTGRGLLDYSRSHRPVVAES